MKVKILDYMYFNFYNLYYKDGNCKPTDNPGIRAAYTFSIVLNLWVILVNIVYSSFWLHTKKLLPLGVFIITYFVFFVPLYFYYYDSKRYEIIYQKFKGMSKKQRIIGRAIVVIITFFPFLVAMTLTALGI